MSMKRTLVKGTFLLTAAGIISRMIGFYYRIFLNNKIGAEGIGLYQLIFPVYAICLALTCSGMETAISRLVAFHDKPDSRGRQHLILYIGLSICLGLSLLTSFFLYFYADKIALYFLKEPRCRELLRILAFCIPLSAIHSSICGYYLGIKKASLPAAAQLTEQTFRVGSVFLIAHILTSKHQLITPGIAVWGLFLGEGGAVLLSVTVLLLHLGTEHTSSWQKYQKQSAPKKKYALRPLLHPLLQQFIPLTLNRLTINLLQSIETVLIPSMLKVYGLSTSSALSIYGILIGMAFPLILFPSALTNAVSVMLLPAIAQAQANQASQAIQQSIRYSVKYCLILGTYCTAVFYLLGNDIGQFLFHTSQAGTFIRTLSFLCPFLYLTTTLGSIVHGLGKTFRFFLCNCICLLIRILFVIGCIPHVGILGYLWGLLVSQLALTCLLLVLLRKNCNVTALICTQTTCPVVSFLVCVLLYKYLSPVITIFKLSAFFDLLTKGMLLTFLFALCTLTSHILQPNICSSK